MKLVILIHAFTALLIMTLVNSMVLSNRAGGVADLTQETPQQSPVRVRRNAINYNQCPTGYKRITAQLCIPCNRYEKNSGEPC